MDIRCRRKGPGETSDSMDIGHNGGPPIDDDEPPGKLLFLKWAWRKTHTYAGEAPTTEIALFRLARAEAAGITYEAYVAQLLDTGRYDQAGDKMRARNRTDTIPKPNSAAGNSRRTAGPLLQSRPQSPHPAQVRNPNGRPSK
jgi:hypothetical protein